MITGKFFIIVGLVLVILGLVINYAPGLISWFGKLPGDIRYEEGNKMLFIPVTSMIIISIILTVVVNIFFRK